MTKKEDRLIHYESPTHNRDLVSYLKTCFLAQDLCDITLRISSSSSSSSIQTCDIKAHKLVLSFGSKLLRRRILGTSLSVIELPNEDIDIVKTLIHFIYDGTLSYRESELSKIVETSKRFEIDVFTNEGKDMTIYKDNSIFWKCLNCDSNAPQSAQSIIEHSESDHDGRILTLCTVCRITSRSSQDIKTHECPSSPSSELKEEALLVPDLILHEEDDYEDNHEGSKEGNDSNNENSADNEDGDYEMSSTKVIKRGRPKGSLNRNKNSRDLQNKKFCESLFGNTNDENLPNVGRQGNNKKYLCSLCGRTLTGLTAYNRHQVIHTGARPFCCETCGKSFTQNQRLTVHKRSHTGERPYLCSLCGKTFTESCKLKRHLALVHKANKDGSALIPGQGVINVDDRFKTKSACVKVKVEEPENDTNIDKNHHSPLQEEGTSTSFSEWHTNH